MASSTEEQKLPYMQETKNPKEHVGDEQQYGLSTRDDGSRQQRLAMYRERISSLRIELSRYEELLRLEEETDMVRRVAVRYQREDMLFELEMKSKKLDIASKERQAAIMESSVENGEC